MANNFFGFNSDFAGGIRALGRPLDDDEFLTDDVEEEYDALNDETFGHAANDDWEEAHEKLSDLIKNNNIDVKSYFHDSLLENDDSQEQIVSKSLSQLGLEDDTIDDPAIMTISRNCRSSSRLGSVFGPSPPPPAILETEICGSPKTHSIWSTTPNDSGISFLQSLSHGSNSLSHQDTHLHSSSSDNVFTSPQKAWRAEELERDLLSSSKQEKTSSESTKWPQTSPISTTNQNLSNKFQSQRFPNLNHNQNNGNQRVFTREEVERQYQRAPFQNKLGNFGPLPHPVPLSHPNMPPMRSGNMNIPMQTPTAVNMRLRGHLMGSPDRPFVPFSPNMHPTNMLPNQMPRPDFMLPNHPMASVLNQYIGMPARPINHPLMPNYKQPFMIHNQILDENYRNEMQSEDEYAGVMTQKEKNWLIRIQMYLLKPENPYTQDYYYTTMLARKCKQKYSENHKKGSGDAPELILPDTPRPEKAYVPTQFAGSLGKLQAVSVNFPRKVLDFTFTRTSEDEVVTNQSLMKYRRLLLDIERLYTYLLEIEDEERRILAKPDTGEAPHRRNIETLTQKIYNGLCLEPSPEENLQNIMTIRKGRNLFVRVLSLFNKNQQLKCLTCLCSFLSVMLRKDQVDLILVKRFEVISDAVQKFNLPDLVALGDALENGGSSESSKSNLVIALKNKFGSSLISTMVERAENLYPKFDLFDSDIQTRWSRLVLLLTDLLCNMNDDALCPPLSPSTELLTHVKRFDVDNDKFEILKEKLQILQKASQNGSDTKNI